MRLLNRAFVHYLKFTKKKDHSITAPRDERGKETLNNLRLQSFLRTGKQQQKNYDRIITFCNKN